MRFVWSALLSIAVLGCGNHDGGGNGTPDAADAVPCEGIGCMQVPCSGGGTTSISGTVFAPNGTLPIYNATVYVPLRTVAPVTTGVTCDRCAELSGTPLVQTTTDESGHFQLTNVPATSEVPVVIQVGKWRRQIKVPAVPACVDTVVDTGMTRLPKNKTEGDIPQMAITTGNADALECLLRKIGLEDSEFTIAGGTGRVHLFEGKLGTKQFDPAHGGAAFTNATTMWNTEAGLSAYDVVFLSCEGAQYADQKLLAARQAMKAYADKGGRVFASHWHNYWLEAGPAPWNTAITFQYEGRVPGETDLPDLGNVPNPPRIPDPAVVDTSFAKAGPLSRWLTNVGASTTPGTIALRDAQHTAIGYDPTKAERWIWLPTTPNGKPSVQYVAMTTPLESPADQKCGRVVFSDIHVSGGPNADKSAEDLLYPSGGCITPVTQLTPQEKMLAFMIFDISSCVGDPIE
jgi:hypothetical protein